MTCSGHRSGTSSPVELTTGPVCVRWDEPDGSPHRRQRLPWLPPVPDTMPKSAAGTAPSATAPAKAGSSPGPPAHGTTTPSATPRTCSGSTTRFAPQGQVTGSACRRNRKPAGAAARTAATAVSWSVPRDRVAPRERHGRPPPAHPGSARPRRSRRGRCRRRRGRPRGRHRCWWGRCRRRRCGRALGLHALGRRPTAPRTPRAPEGPIGRDRRPQGATGLPSRPCPLCGHAGPRPLPAGSVFGRRS